MKVTKEKAVFTPVTIVLESQAEVDLLVSLLGNTLHANVNRVFGVDSATLYDALSVHGDCTETKNTIEF